MNNMARCKLQRYPLIGVLSALLLGCVLPVCAQTSLSIESDGAFSIYPGMAVVNQSIATIEITSDEEYVVTLRDDNDGVLTDGQNVMRYSVSYDRGPQITLSGTPTKVEATAIPVLDSGIRSLTLFISGEQSVGIPAGPYGVTVTAEITAL
jgi:hypothetical protein